MSVKIGNTFADTSIKLGNTTIQSGYIGTNYFYGNQLPILDLYPTSVHHAYSLRRLRTSYSGFCLRVRRTSGTSTEVNVGFDSNNQISLTSPITYASGTATTATTLGQFAAIAGYGTADAGVTANQSIFVVTWYDQSGNAKNLTQGTAGNQPSLINAGALETTAGKVAVRFTRSTGTILTVADTTANINNMASYFVGQYTNVPDTTATASVGYSLSGGTTTTGRFNFPNQSSPNSPGIFAGYGANQVAMTLVTTADTNRYLFELICPFPTSTTLAQAYSNGVAKGTRTIVNSATVSITLGGANTGSAINGYIQEVIGWQSNLNRVEKENNINGYWQVY